MQLITFSDDDGVRLGVLSEDGGQVLDLAAADSDLPRDMTALIAHGPSMLQRVRRAVRAGKMGLQAADIHVLAPIPRPRRNVFCVGKNYPEHAKEFHSSGFDASAGATAAPDFPIIFTKAPSSVIGPGQAIPAFLDPTDSLDYEGELAVVIGKGGRGIRAEDAYGHVFGYTLINDITARGLQRRHRQWFLGKSLDGFCPMGPTLVTADQIPDVTDLCLVTRVNGEVRQDAKVADLIFDIPTLIETISAGITLEPGDIIATGTPEGVGIGFNPPRFLKSGDEVAITIEPIGELKNSVEG